MKTMKNADQPGLALKKHGKYARLLVGKSMDNHSVCEIALPSASLIQLFLLKKRVR
jgi:hypothetical protein